jgi:transcriptional regulator with XRE-family HTH domain
MNIIHYYFDTLPLRPQLQPFESFTSYLTRVGEANGIRRYSQLNPFFREYRGISSFVDYPPRSFAMLPTIINCSESELLRTTFYHVGKKFGRLYHSPWLTAFLSGVVASSLRFCPLCLQEALYYSLVWRFLTLQGCPKHACRLLEHCGHCGYSVSIFPAPFRMGICPTCGGDLCECIPSGLTEEELLGETVASRELEFLLSPQQWETTDPAFLEKIGQEFLLLRYNKQLKQIDVSAETKLSMETLRVIELGQNGSKRAILRWYFMYASYLGVPLSHIFINAVERKEEDLRIKTTPGKYFLRSEDWVMQSVQEATKQMEISGQFLTIKAVSAATGISKGGLYKYDGVKAFLGEKLYHKKLPSRMQDPQFEEQLLEKAKQAVQELSQARKPITHHAVCSLLGIPSGAIVRYPQLKKFLGQFVDYALQQQIHTEEREQAFLEQVRIGVMELEDQQLPVTYKAISQKIGIRSSTWLAYAQVRAFVEQHLDSRYLRTLKEREQREEVLIPRVVEALNQLETAGESMTFESVGKLLGVNPTTLKTYSHVNVLIEKRKSSPRERGGQGRRSEEEVLSDVQRIISSLIGRGASVNYRAIAHEMGGISALTLQTYPKVRMLVDEYLQSYHLYQLQQFALREEQLLSRMEATITELEALGKPFTQSELCEMIGKSSSSLRRYPRVNALLKQKATRYHVFQRRREQPEEEDLMQRVKEAIIDLTDSGEHITPDKVARKVNLSRYVLMQYPLVVLFLEQSGYKKRKPRSEREEELLNLLREAINACKNNGQPITQKKLSDMVGVSPFALLRYPQVRALMTQAVSEDKQEQQEHRFQVCQEEMTQQVILALQQLRDQNRKITKRAVEKLVHYSEICSRYPKVRVLIESAIQTQRATNESDPG